MLALRLRPNQRHWSKQSDGGLFLNNHRSGMYSKPTHLKEREMPRAKESKRELINTGTDKRYVRRDAEGRFKESDDQGRSLSQDRKRQAKTTVKPGQGDRGDQKRS